MELSAKQEESSSAYKESVECIASSSCVIFTLFVWNVASPLERDELFAPAKVHDRLR